MNVDLRSDDPVRHRLSPRHPSGVNRAVTPWFRSPIHLEGGPPAGGLMGVDFYDPGVLGRPSRHVGFALAGLRHGGQGGAPHWTNDLDHRGAVWPALSL